MRIVIQRVINGRVIIDEQEYSAIGTGLVMLVGFCHGDDSAIVEFMAAKTAGLRIFSDENGAMNLSLLDVDGEMLAVSNFTLYANCRKGKRPSFTDAAAPGIANQLYELFVQKLRENGVRSVKTGVFGADMRVEIANDGPVTIILDSAEIMPKH